jgi:hypothetical protein
VALFTFAKIVSASFLYLSFVCVWPELINFFKKRIQIIIIPNEWQCIGLVFKFFNSNTK